MFSCLFKGTPCFLSKPVSSGDQYCEIYGTFTQTQAVAACQMLGAGYGIVEFPEQRNWDQFSNGDFPSQGANVNILK